MKEALFYKSLEKGIVHCQLCPKSCRIAPGKAGNCFVRENHNGKLTTPVYNRVSAINVDPVEKKPLFHFYPGTRILSIGGIGCNFHCNFCQNHSISQCHPSDFYWLKKITADEIIEQAKRLGNNIGIAYTYNEPFIFYEFMLDISVQARQNGLKNVAVSNGYISKAPLLNILPYIDAFNIDLKAFNNKFYKEQVRGHLAPVLENLKIIANSKAHLEITYLVIPGLNDNLSEFDAMTTWIAENLGKDVPFHLSRYFPNYKMTLPATSEELLIQLYRLAREKINHVFLGNVYTLDKANTYCPVCGYEVISRNRYVAKPDGLDSSGACLNCGEHLPVVI